MAAKLTVQNVLNYLEKLAPPSLAEDWDNVGLQVGNPADFLTGVVVSLDVTEAVLWEAVEHDANCLVTHHPLFFRPVTTLTDLQIPTRLARLASQMGINILSFHTNLDASSGGLNDLMAKALKLSALKGLIPSRDSRYPKAGLGRVGTIKKTTLKNFVPRVAKALKVKQLRFVGDPKHSIQRVAVMTGSGGGFFQEAQEAGADVLITGDVKYHAALDSLSIGMTLIDVGHFAGEIGMVSSVATKLRSFLKKKNTRLVVYETEAQEDPFQFWS